MMNETELSENCRFRFEDSVLQYKLIAMVAIMALPFKVDDDGAIITAFQEDAPSSCVFDDLQCAIRSSRLSSWVVITGFPDTIQAEVERLKQLNVPFIIEWEGGSKQISTLADYSKFNDQ